MPWRLVRLEHAPTSAFPAGSVARAYHLRIPLKPDGFIDPEIHAEDPLRSTVRRFWPNEQDRSGYVVRKRLCWSLIAVGDECEEKEFGWFEDCAFLPAGHVAIVEPVNGALPFQVAAIKRD